MSSYIFTVLCKIFLVKFFDTIISLFLIISNRGTIRNDEKNYKSIHLQNSEVLYIQRPFTDLMFPSTSPVIQHLAASYSRYQIVFAHRINTINHLPITHTLNATFAVVNKREKIFFNII